MGKRMLWNHIENFSFSSTFCVSLGTKIEKRSCIKKSVSKSELGIVLFGKTLCSSHLTASNRHCTFPGLTQYSIVARFFSPRFSRLINLAPAFGPLNLKPLTKTEYATMALNNVDTAPIAVNRIFPVVVKKSNLNLRGLLNDLFARTFNLKQFHGAPVRSGLCALALCILTAIIPTDASAQFSATSTVLSTAAVTSANAYLLSSRSDKTDRTDVFKPLRVVNQPGAMDLSGKRICIVPKGSYLRVNNCRRGDVIVIEEGTLRQIMEVCKLDEPVYSYKGAFACVYEDHEKKFYTAPDKKRSTF